MGFIVFIAASILYVLSTIINFFVVLWKYSTSHGFFRTMDRYFWSTSVDIDKFANHNFRTLWNTILCTKQGYQFGHKEETISSALGKNLVRGTLTGFGCIVCHILDFFDKNHCIKSIDNSVNSREYEKP